MQEEGSHKAVRAGAMIAEIFAHGEALITVGHTTVALTPEELEALYRFLKQHYEGKA